MSRQLAPLSIEQLNDAFRAALPFGGRGRAVMTRAVAALPPEQLARVLDTVRRFAAFTPDNDPWGEHDCATFVVDGERFLFKFDYYDSAACEGGAESGGSECYRVLTIMTAADY